MQCHAVVDGGIARRADGWAKKVPGKPEPKLVETSRPRLPEPKE